MESELTFLNFELDRAREELQQVDSLKLFLEAEIIQIEKEITEYENRTSK